MRDKSLGIFLVVLFGISGITVLMLAWVQPMPKSETILATLIGSTGLFVALVRALLLKYLHAGADAEQVPVEVKDKP